MVRTLPWLKNGQGQKRAADPPKAKRRRVDGGSASPPPSPSGRSARSTSTAPHGSSKLGAKLTATAEPDDIYMVAGLSHDDGYMMMEDQFLTIAKSFTSTLHSAEYQRRKALAASAPYAFPNSIPRHVLHHPSTMPAERKVANRATAHKRSVITATGAADVNTSNVSDDEDEEEAVRAMLKAEGDNASGTVWAKGALGRLMRTAPTKVERRLAVGKGAAKTRAAAGFKIGNMGSPTKSQRTSSQGVPSSPLRGKGGHGSDDEDDDGDGDLDGFEVKEELDTDDETTDDCSDGLDVVPPPKLEKPGFSATRVTTTNQPNPRIHPPTPPRSRDPAPARRPPTTTASSPTHPKSILRKAPKAPPIIVLSSDEDDMDDAEAERWKQRKQEQQRREEVKAAKEKTRAEEEEKRKHRSSATAPVSFLGLKYS